MAPLATVYPVTATQCIFLDQTPLVNSFFGLSFHLRHYLGQSDNFEMGKELSEVSNSEFYLMNFWQKLILLIFFQHCFLAPRLEILHTSQVCICLGICFEIFFLRPHTEQIPGGGAYGPPPPGSNELPGHPGLRGLIVIISRG